MKPQKIQFWADTTKKKAKLQNKTNKKWDKQLQIRVLKSRESLNLTLM